MKNLIGNITKGAEIVDEFTESAQERQKVLSDRHKTDMNSDNWLSKSIRPLSLLILLGLVSFMGVMSTFERDPDPIIMGEIVVLLGTAFGFYFDSRKREKMAAKNAEANIQMEKIKTKHQMRQERKQLRADIKAARRAERDQEKEDYNNQPIQS